MVRINTLVNSIIRIVGSVCIGEVVVSFVSGIGIGGIIGVMGTIVVDGVVDSIWVGIVIVVDSV